VLEEMRQGLELNKWEYMQRRLTNMKLLGELYAFKLVDSHTIFDALYTLITLGHAAGYASQIAADKPSDFIRIRLVCVLLNTVGQYFVKGSTRRRLDVFLKYFQKYIFLKPTAPIDVTFTIDDCFAEIRTKVPRYETYEDVCAEIKRIEEMEQKSDKLKGKHENRALAGSSARPVKVMETLDEGSDDEDDKAEGEDVDVDEDENEEEDEEEDEELEEADDDEAALQNPPEEAEEQEQQQESTRAELIVDEEDDRRLYSRQQAKYARELEDSFDKEFQAMMMESITQRKASEAPKGSISDMAVPAQLQRREGNAPNNFRRDAYDDESDEEAEPQMMFQLLCRKGKNVATQEIAVPLASRFAQHHQAQEVRAHQERERMRDQVLAYEAMDQDDDYSRGDPRWGRGNQRSNPQHRHGGRYNQRGPQLEHGGSSQGRGLLEFNVRR